MMITIYEAILILKNIPKQHLASSIKRTTNAVLNRNGFYRDIKYLGLQKIPYRHSKDGVTVPEAHYLFYEFNVAKIKLPEIVQEWKLDRDIVKCTVFDRIADKKPINFDQCTFEDEIKPVPYRSEVMKLVERAKRYAQKRSHVANLHMNSPYFPLR